MRVQREIVGQQAHRLLDEVAAELAAARQPVATYRLQLHEGFTFDGAAAIARYLAELGITDLYTSPILTAAPGSMHGYDVTDYGTINPELGGAEGYERLASALHEAGLGHVLIFVLEHMPSRHEQDPARQEERRREKEVVKRRVAALCASSAAVREHLEENVRIFNGTQGKPRSFDLLDKLLDAQAYRLAHWRVSSEEINYRRFFDINSLAAVRMEDPEVFEHAHRLPLRFLAEGRLAGLRIDHPDGLAYPRRYFRLLQNAHIMQRAQARARERGLRWDESVVREELEQTRDPRLTRPLFVVAEKILARTETLPSSWA